MSSVATPVSITWKPDPVVFRDAILDVAEALEDRSTLLLAARQYIQDDIREHFQTESDPDGMPWEPWADSYVGYAEEYPNVGILRQTNELYDEATSNRAFIISHDTVFYDSSVMPERGIWHQEGRANRTTKQGTPNPLPQRSFLGLSDESQALITLVAVDWFDRAIDLYETSTGRLGRRHRVRSVSTGRFIPRVR